MDAPQIESLLSDRALLVATCEALTPHMNGKSMWRLTFLLKELALYPSGESLLPGDREWLESGVRRGLERRRGWQVELERLQHAGVTVIACTDSEYPLNLHLVHNGPPLLFVRGVLRASDRRSIAIVGTRGASPAGLELATQLATDSARRGYTIVSGLATGIDSAAHAAALNAAGRTIAVFGTDVERVFPTENRPLARAIRHHGACISQFFPGTPPRKWTFPARNITTSGLSLATVVVEASESSGARLQAQAALNHGKLVFLIEDLVTGQPWAKEMLASAFNAMPAKHAHTIVNELDRHLKIVADSSFTFT